MSKVHNIEQIRLFSGEIVLRAVWKIYLLLLDSEKFLKRDPDISSNHNEYIFNV